MLKMMKTSVFVGIGMAALADEKFHSLTDRLVEKGERCQQEGKSPLHNLQHAIAAKKAEITTKRDEYLQGLLQQFSLLTKDHLTEFEHNLEQKLGKIDNRLAKLEKHLKTRSK
jgi:polyhydroxyalkanoate synthesis regulator phasin